MMLGDRLRGGLAIAVLALGPAGALRAQQAAGQGSGQGPPLSTQPSLPPIAPSLGTVTPEMEATQERLRNADRQKRLVSDTEKLLALANELKVEVDKSSKDTLSLDVVRKADEIEKLAHSVKEKMKGS